MKKDEEKIACYICKKEIPKAAALHAEGQGYVFHFCNTDCMDYWEKNKEKKLKKGE